MLYIELYQFLFILFYEKELYQNSKVNKSNISSKFIFVSRSW